MSSATVIIGALKIMLDSRTSEAEAVTALNVLRKRGLAWHEVFAVIRSEPNSTERRARVQEASKPSDGWRDFERSASRFDDVAFEFTRAAAAFEEEFRYFDWIRTARKAEKSSKDFTCWPYSFRMPFGAKHIGETLGAIMQNDATYIRWLLSQAWIEKRWPDLFQAIKEIERRAKGKR